MSKHFEWKYDLCENEIQCDGRTIAYADNSIFDIKDKEEFGVALRDLGLKLGWMVERANAGPDMLEALKTISTLSIDSGSSDDPVVAMRAAIDFIYQVRRLAAEAITKAEGREK